MTIISVFNITPVLTVSQECNRPLDALPMNVATFVPNRPNDEQFTVNDLSWSNYSEHLAQKIDSSL